MKYFLLLTIGGILLFMAIGCDDLSSTSGSDNAVLTSLTIEPNSVQFGIESSFSDTTVTIQLLVNTLQGPENELRYTIERQAELFSEGTFNSQSETSYQTEFSLTVSTSLNANYTIYVFEDGNTSGERLQGSLQIRGKNVAPPVIEEAYNTEEVSIPESGNQRIDFYARVVHPEDQEFISRVNFFLIDQSGSQLGSNFQMFDNGIFNEVEGFIDEVEGDSLYSRAFFINPNNSPDEITVNYYAIGIDGQSSDTLQTQLSIVE